jgi:hypothetical protein
LNKEHLLPKIIANKKQLNLSVPQTNAANNNESLEFINDMKRLEMWRCFCVLMSPDLTRIVEFAKRVPGFKSIGQNEQVVLIKAHFFKVWLLRIASMFLSAVELRETGTKGKVNDSAKLGKENGEPVFLTFESGHCITREQLELIYDVILIISKFF